MAGVPTRKLRDDLNAAGSRSSRGQRVPVRTLLPMAEYAACVGWCVDARCTLNERHRSSACSGVECQDAGDLAEAPAGPEQPPIGELRLRI